MSSFTAFRPGGHQDEFEVRHRQTSHPQLQEDGQRRPQRRCTVVRGVLRARPHVRICGRRHLLPGAGNPCDARPPERESDRTLRWDDPVHRNEPVLHPRQQRVRRGVLLSRWATIQLAGSSQGVIAARQHPGIDRNIQAALVEKYRRASYNLSKNSILSLQRGFFIYEGSAFAFLVIIPYNL